MNNKRISFVITLIIITVLSYAFQLPATETTAKRGSEIFPKGLPAGNKYFTNKVWVQMLETDQEKNFDTQVYNVTFEPAARTFWHSHPGG